MAWSESARVCQSSAGGGLVLRRCSSAPAAGGHSARRGSTHGASILACCSRLPRRTLDQAISSTNTLPRYLLDACCSVFRDHLVATLPHHLLIYSRSDIHPKHLVTHDIVDICCWLRLLLRWGNYYYFFTKTIGNLRIVFFSVGWFTYLCFIYFYFTHTNIQIHRYRIYK